MNNIEIDWICSKLKEIGNKIQYHLIDNINKAKRKNGVPIVIDRSSYGKQTEFEKEIRDLIPTINVVINKIKKVNKNV